PPQRAVRIKKGETESAYRLSFAARRDKRLMWIKSELLGSRCLKRDADGLGNRKIFQREDLPMIGVPEERIKSSIVERAYLSLASRNHLQKFPAQSNMSRCCMEEINTAVFPLTQSRP
ncbi:MAG: hypothetical protein RR773_01295, partial [Raoultibacter sp.]